MKKPFFAFVIFGICSVCAGHAFAETIKMGFFEIKPYMYENKTTKKAAGASVRYFEAMALKMGYDVEWVGPLPFPRLVQYLTEGAVDGTLLFTKNDERTQYLHYPNSPYHQVQSVFVLRKDDKTEKIASAEDVKGYVVGYLKGVNLSGFVKDNEDKLKMEHVLGDMWASQNLNKLILGRIDAIYDLNSYTLPYEAKLAKVADKIKTLSLPEPPKGVYAVFSKKSAKGKTLLEKYEKAFEGSVSDHAEFLEKEFE